MIKSFNYVKIIIFIIFTAISGLSVTIMLPDYSRIGANLIVLSGFLTYLMILDIFILPEKNIINEIVDNQNIALSVFVIGIYYILIFGT